jgi:2-polyprenyl-3-methyl-5-hydroxy-6-metoxy-1,4-benzoquinol methylase
VTGIARDSEISYYDWRRGRLVGDEDGCKLEEWPALATERSFALHPKGFPIFLAPDLLAASDEYAEGDRYLVEDRIDNAFHRRRSECTRALLRQALADGPAEPRILDLGCGQGHLTEEIRAEFPGAQIAACDYSLSAIEYAAPRFPEIEFAVADAMDPPYPPESFDAVICNNIWEHVPDPLRLLAAVRRVLRMGGCVVISTPSRYHFYNLMRGLMGKRLGRISPMHVTEYSVGQVKEQLRFGGFEFLAVTSMRIPVTAGTLRRKLAVHVLLPLLRAYIRMSGSHHVLETTAFYLARKVEPSGAS